jgi:hypothetical protein
MAGKLPLVELTLLGFELCGNYRMLPDDTRSEAASDGSQRPPEQDFRKAKPFTSVAKLGTYVARMPGVKGHKRAVQALRHITDNSASPMESILELRKTAELLAKLLGKPLRGLDKGFATRQQQLHQQLLGNRH